MVATESDRGVGLRWWRVPGVMRRTIPTLPTSPRPTPMASVRGASRTSFAEVVETTDPAIYDVRTKADGPAGSLPLTDEMLRDWPSGDLFGLSQDAGMGWAPSQLGRKEFLILSTSGGIRADDGTPIALGYHTGHWEVGLLMQAAARELKER